MARSVWKGPFVDMTLIKKAENSLIRDVAKLKLSYLNVDSSSFDDVEEELSVILGDDNPLSLFAYEVLAMSAYKHGLYERGSDYLNIIITNEKTTNIDSIDTGFVFIHVINSFTCSCNVV